MSIKITPRAKKFMEEKGIENVTFRLVVHQTAGCCVGGKRSALYHGMNVEDLNELDLSYTPPLSSPYDPIQMAAQAWCRKMKE